MCFSAEASFTSAALLLPAGIYCVKVALDKNRPLLCLAVIPVIFGIQQFAEGLAWLGLDRSDPAFAHAAGMVFLAFALAFWPFWVPMCGWLLEPPGPKRLLCGCFAALGLIGGLAMYVPLLLDPGVLVVRTSHHSIHYDMARSPAFVWMPMIVWELLYVAIVAVPPMLSRTTGIFLFSIGLVASAAISQIFFWYATASVWCFFAAILSLYLCLAFWRMPVAFFRVRG
jgi:uncharacterized protein DUF6629